MNRKQWGLAIALALVLAGAVTWQLRRHRAAAPAPHAAAPGPQRPGGFSTPPDEPEMRGGPPRVLADDDPVGALRLEGQVLDAADQPVADAVIALASNPPRQTHSGADGTFAFDGLLARPYTMTARATSGVAGPVTARLTATSDPVVLRLRTAAQVTVEVVDAQQRPVDVATVELRGVDVQVVTTKAGRATVAPVVPGFYQAVAWAEGYARTFLPTTIGTGANSLRLELARGAAVSGKVVDERGAPVAQARVRYDTASDFLPGSDLQRDAVVTAADGTFAFAALPAGSFRFVATHAELSTGVSELVPVDGSTAKTGVEIVLPVGAVVAGKVVGSDGKPVDSARVRIGIASAGFRTALPPREAYSNAAGEFSVRGLPRRPLSAVALHEAGASSAADVDTSAGDVSGVTLTLDATGTLSGIVVDAAGQPIEGAQVSAFPDFGGRLPNPGGPGGRGGPGGPGGRGGPGGAAPARNPFSQWQLRGFPQELSDASGQFRLTGLTPGSYRVRATRSAAVSRGRGFTSDGVVAEAGASNVRIVLPAEGAIKGKVVFDDHGAPDRFTVALGFSQQSFGDGQFVLDSLTPQSYQLVLRGASFQTRILEVTVEPGKTTDLGTLVVTKGRQVAGVVTAEGKPVAGATVYAGRQIMGSGTSSAGRLAAMMPGLKTTTTGPDGVFALDGFADEELTVVAEHPAQGRSRAVTVTAQPPGQERLTLALLPFGAVRGGLRQGGKALEGVMVIAQSVTSAGALYTVASGPDGAYRFDRLAPDTYKISATVGMPMTGMKQYSRQVAVVSGQEAVVDLVVEPGTVSLELKVTAQAGTVGMVSWAVVSGRLEAATAKELRARMAAAGPGASQFGVGAVPVRVTEVAAGVQTVCVVAFPRELDGPMRVFPYSERYGDRLATVCKSLEVRSAPAEQSLDVAVVVPPLISEPGKPSDSPPGGPGSGGPPPPPPR